MSDQASLQVTRAARLLKVRYSILVIVSLLLPLLYLLELCLRSYSSVSEWMLLLLLNATLALFLFLVWPYHSSSMYLRYALPIAFLIIAGFSFTTLRRMPLWPVDLSTTWLSILLNLIFTSYFTWSSVRALSGYRYRKPAIRLTFPLQAGCYSVAHGGSNTAINYHATNTAQRYANDIVKLNRWGNRARGLYPPQLAAYCIFGDPVYSPCDGLVVSAIDGLPDLTPAEMDRTHIAGNHIIIAYQGYTILLAHLQRGSVLVQAGERVYQGQPVGKVGNSGHTSEPHLHIHAEQGGSPGTFGDGAGVPIVFGEHGFLKRNDLIFLPRILS